MTGAVYVTTLSEDARVVFAANGSMHFPVHIRGGMELRAVSPDDSTDARAPPEDGVGMTAEQQHTLHRFLPGRNSELCARVHEQARKTGVSPMAEFLAVVAARVWDRDDRREVLLRQTWLRGMCLRAVMRLVRVGADGDATCDERDAQRIFEHALSV